MFGTRTRRTLITAGLSLAIGVGIAPYIPVAWADTPETAVGEEGVTAAPAAVASAAANEGIVTDGRDILPVENEPEIPLSDGAGAPAETPTDGRPSASSQSPSAETPCEEPAKTVEDDGSGQEKPSANASNGTANVIAQDDGPQRVDETTFTDTEIPWNPNPPDITTGNETNQFTVYLLHSETSIKLGSSVEFSPQISGIEDTSGFTFNYVWAYGSDENDWSSWSSTQLETNAYTADSSWEFVPTQAGTYRIYIDVVSPDGSSQTVRTSVQVAAAETTSWTADLSLSSASVVSGTGVTLTPAVEGADASGFTYNYGWCYNGEWDEWDSTVKAGGSKTSATSWSFTPSRIGRYLVFVDVTDPSGKTSTVSAWVEVTAPTWSAQAVASSATFERNEPVTVTPKVSGTSDTSGFTYNYVWCYNGEWDDWGSTVLDTGGYTSQASWEFTPKRAGTYVLYIDVVDPAGNTKTVSTSIEVAKPSWSATVGLSAQKASLGESVTVTPKVSGTSDTSGFTYNYVWCYNGEWDDWGSTVLDTGGYTSQASWEFTPKRTGRYQIYVDVRSQTGVVFTYSAWVEVGEAAWTAGIETSPNVAKLDQPVAVTPHISGASDTSGFTYNYVWCYNGEWDDWGSTVLDTGGYTSQASWEFTPTRSGRYQIYVDVRDPWGTVRTYGASIEVSDENLSFSSVQLEYGDGPAIGSPVTITPQFTADTASHLAFRYTWERADGASGLISDWSDAQTATWNVDVSGPLTIVVEIRDSGGTVVRRETRLDVPSESWSFDNLESSSTCVRLGGSFTFTGAFSGTTDYLSYTCTASNGSREISLQPVDGQPGAFSWTPTSVGTYDVTLTATGSDGTPVSKTLRVAVWYPGELEATTSDGGKTWQVGVDLGIDDPASFGFSFNYVWNQDGAWSNWGSTLLSTGSYTSQTSNTFEFNTAAYYDIYVDYVAPDGSVVTKSTRVLYAPSGKIGYQNPSGYYQVSSNDVAPNPNATGIFAYMTPSRISVDATREECVEAFIARATEYLGTPYVWNYACAPGVGVDCIGLVFQCAYACGMDLGEFNPYDHYATGPDGWHSHDAANMWNYGNIQRLDISQRQRGDLIFYPGHVAIYLGNDLIIEATPREGSVVISSVWTYTPIGVGRMFL